MTAKFCLLPIVVEDRRYFTDALGVRVDEYPLPIGSVFLQWADAPRAMGWFAKARRMLEDTARIDQLNAPVNITDKGANNRQAAEQFQYVYDVLDAFARGYNLLNIVWHNDPVARELYRQYIAGPPQASGMNAGAVFSAKLDYNPAWYTKDEFLPRAQDAEKDNAILQKDAIKSAKGKPGDRFAPSALLVLASMDALPNNGPVALSQRVFNAPVLTTALQQRCPTGLFYKDLMPGATDTTVDFTAALDFPWRKRCESGAKGFGTWPKPVMPDGKELPDEFDDWRAAYRGNLYQANLFDQGDYGITAPLFSYVRWLQDWALEIATRTPTQIIQDARAFTAWQNLQTLNTNASALGQISGLGDTINSQQHAADQGWAIASGTLAAVGAVATATGTPQGALVGLIAGAASAVISATDALVVKGTKDIGRDDLGRYKPQLERAWLSGTPATAQASNGAPALPDFSLQDPPGEGKFWFPQDCPTAPIGDPSQDLLKDPLGKASKAAQDWWQKLSRPSRWAVGLGAGVAGASLLVAASRSPQPAARMPRRFKKR